MSAATATGTLAPRTVLADALPGARTRDAALVVGGALLTALLAQVTVPMTPVPMTGQTLAVGLVGATLGLRRGVLSMLLYVVMGFVLPVYADGASGIATLWGATGGYLVGFLLATAVIGRLAERGADRKVHLAFLAFVLAQAVIFVPGVLVLQAVTGMAWADAIHSGFTVFIVGGLVKAAVGGLVLPSAWQLVRRVER
ncbi:biotin transporter BioY [Patulibacter sp. SYSU D01012]|uniref:biotin transporter BioY n=1 Tax=Patulibacter sp. SYSU D01012 TaxID=2817381 RepID=UPI001B307C60|nr:biotin transporter BioY [Patulibacter sp. SYSU D01012]